MEKTQAKWTRKTYDALHQWTQGPVAKEQCIVTLTRNGLADVVAQLRAADNLGVWYRLTQEAAAAVGCDIVASSARQAERELDEICK